MSSDHGSLSIPLNAKNDILVNRFLDSKNNHLFNEPKYFNLHSSDQDDLYIQLVRKKDAVVCATVAFFKESTEQYVSPLRGTFGGISINHEVDLAVLDEFIRKVISILSSKQARAISIELPPASHNLSAFSLMYNILARQGFSITSNELNYDMLINSEKFIDRIMYGSRKRIKKCLNNGFIAEQLKPSQYADAFSVIKENRTRKGFPLSMSYHQLQEMFKLFPDKFHVFGVFTSLDRTTLAAAAICIVVSQDILYVFYWGDANGMTSYSPVVLLAQEIYQYCQEHKINILDVGTSTINGEPNYGLIRFKKNLGFNESLKVTLRYTEEQ